MTGPIRGLVFTLPPAFLIWAVLIGTLALLLAATS